MINRQSLRHWVRTHVSWQLALALGISLLVHLFVLQEAAWQSWFVNDAPVPVLLQAQLELPTPQPKPVKMAPAHSDRPKKSPAAKPKKVVPAPDRVLQPQKDLPADIAEPAEPSAVEDAEAIRQAEIDAWHATDHIGLPEPEEVLPPPYQRVSTDFSVYVNAEKTPAGRAKIEYVQEDDGQQYALYWVVEGRGLLKLLYPTLEQQSHGDIDQHGLKPHTYRYAFGDRASKIYEAAFDWENNVITLKTSKGEQQQDLPRDTQDILSFMYQFMFVPPLQEMHVTLTNGRRLHAYQYEFEGEDSLVINDQTIETVHIAHTRGESDEKIELWLAKDYRYVPVKIRKLEKNGMVIEQIATQLVTE